MIHRRLLSLVLAVMVSAWFGVAAAQIDPERRTYLEGGLALPLRGNGPLDGYGYLLMNRPNFPAPDWYGRLVVAPTYVTSELVRDRWPADGHALGFGLDGGFFQNNFTDFRDGTHRRRESFWGGGVGAAFSYYWRQVQIADLIPVEGILRFRPEYAVYTRDMDTRSAFRLPADSAIYSARAGIRVGGVPPELFPREALELSIYHQVSYRDNARTFGLPDQPQRTRHFTQQTWARALAMLTPWLEHTVAVSFTGGIAENTDALSAFRMGGPFRLRDEFPLVVHGYNTEEVFARRFVLTNASYRFAPVPAMDWLRLQFSGDHAHVHYLRGRSLPHRDLWGLGADVIAALDTDTTAVLGYGYGFNAPRGDRRGGQQIHLLFEKKF